jgi:hypothetical protein
METIDRTKKHRCAREEHDGALEKGGGYGDCSDPDLVEIGMLGAT